MFRWTMLFAIMALACTVAVPVMAQSDAAMTGNYLLGGTMSWNSVDNENAADRTNVWTIAPRAMRFVVDNFAVGAEVAFQGTSQGDDGFSAQRYFALGEYVFPMNNDSFRFYGEAGGGFVRQTMNSVAGDNAVNGWGATGGVGAYFFLNDHVSINPAVSYIYESMGDDSAGNPMGNNQTIFLRIGVTGFLFP